MNEQELQRRLEALGRSVPASEAFTRSVMGRVAGVPAGGAGSRDGHVMRWVMRGTIGLAACAVIGVFAWTLLVSEPQRVYGMEDVARRLAAARSVYISGRLDGVPSGFAMYADRAGARAWQTQGADEAVAVYGGRQVVRDNRARTWTVSPVAAVDVRLTAEVALQGEITRDLLGIGRDAFRKVRSERVGGVMADVYEGRHKAGEASMRVELAVDPRAGVPLREDLYLVMAGETKESHLGTIDRIEIDGPPPAGAFDAEAPAGFAVRHEAGGATGRGPGEWWNPMAGEGEQTTGVRLRIRYAFDVGDGSGVLVCWALYDAARPGEDLKLPGAGTTMAVSGDGGAAYDLRTFRTDATAAGYHWRWSVVVPAAGGKVGRSGTSIDVKAPHEAFYLLLPMLRFSREELAGVVREAQGVTLPAGGKGATLEEIERMVAGGKK